MDVAREFSPRVEVHGFSSDAEGCEVTLDVRGLTRLIGDGGAIATELRRAAAARGVRMQVAVAGTRTAARLLVHHAAPAEVVVIEPGTEADALAPLPIDLLAIFAPRNSQLSNPRSRIPDPFTLTFHRWGVRTLGALAALPPAEVAARLGRAGVAWQREARGEDAGPLVPAVPEERFEQALDLEWPIEGLEPLVFVLGRLLEPLSAHLERRDRGAAVLHVRLHLVTRDVHARSLQLPAPIRDARTLRTLALLDLESHPPEAAIDRVVVAVDPTPGRVVQCSLLTRPLPAPDQLSTLMARLQALMGDGRCGAAVAVDSWEPGAFTMKPFAPPDSTAMHPHEPPRNGPQRHRDTERAISQKDGLRDSASLWPVAAQAVATVPAVALRRFRHPMSVRVRVERGVPVWVIADRRGWSGGRVETCAGPWRTSGGWWIETDEKVRGARVRGCDGAFEDATVRRAQSEKPLDASVSLWPGSVTTWERDEWDVTLGDGATYRIFRDRVTEAWCIEGVID